MKRILFLAFSILVCFNAVGQKSDKKPKILMEVGWATFENNLNVDEHIGQNGGFGHSGVGWLSGVNLKFTLPTPQKYLDFTFGALCLIGEKQTFEVNNIVGYEASQYVTNGGGVYAGISPKWKTPYFGLTSEFCVGIFPFKEYNSVVIKAVEGAIRDDLSMQTARASTFGAMASVGFYVKYKMVVISPSINVIYAGGANTSFLFYGLVFPIGLQF